MVRLVKEATSWTVKLELTFMPYPFCGYNSHWNFLTTLAFLECFYMVLMNKKQVLEESEDFFFTLTSYS